MLNKVWKFCKHQSFAVDGECLDSISLVANLGKNMQKTWVDKKYWEKIDALWKLQPAFPMDFLWHSCNFSLTQISWTSSAQVETQRSRSTEEGSERSRTSRIQSGSGDLSGSTTSGTTMTYDLNGAGQLRSSEGSAGFFLKARIFGAGWFGSVWFCW